MAFGRLGTIGAGFGRVGAGGGMANPWTLLTLGTPSTLTPAGKITWNSGTNTVTIVGALSAEACQASIPPAAIAGRLYRITFSVDVLAGDSFLVRCGNTSSGQLSGTGAKSIDLVAGGAQNVFVMQEWGGSLTDITLSNIKVYLHA